MKLDTTQLLAFDPMQSQRIHQNLSETDSLQQAAEQFEAIFLQLVLKNMHTATDALGTEDGLFASKEQQLFRDMHDAQLAQHLAGQRQLGLAEAIVRQLGAGLTETENKFKELHAAVALQDQVPVQVNPAIDYHSRGLVQPLLLPLRPEELN
ncbi:rod-binding protein [Alishewanella sp. BS5-314]|uniref:rod-binding protein n=1 Tax=Alishewanella sp. BS5-314 TaxID=2755587 RepID=UPI0021BA983F|nr:rod-binding protein [Alishewanella sp. BS5-314]MCT8125022.1 rod-binding protein [Alishewanella sp. BS5-314]